MTVVIFAIPPPTSLVDMTHDKTLSRRRCSKSVLSHSNAMGTADVVTTYAPVKLTPDEYRFKRQTIITEKSIDN